MTLPTRYQKLAEFAKKRPIGPYRLEMQLISPMNILQTVEEAKLYTDYLAECHDQIDSLLSDLSKALEAKEILMEAMIKISEEDIDNIAGESASIADVAFNRVKELEK